MEYNVKLTDRQVQGFDLIKQKTYILLEGGGRAGKTFLTLFVIILRCLLYPETRHLIIRYRFVHIKSAIVYDTMPKILKIMGLKRKANLNKSDWFYEFPNGSQIWLGGIDDKERIEKILGNEYATIFINEASQVSAP